MKERIRWHGVTVSQRKLLHLLLLLIISVMLIMIISPSTSSFTLTSFVSALQQVRRREAGYFDAMFRCGFIENGLVFAGTFTRPGAMVVLNASSMRLVTPDGVTANSGEDNFVACVSDGNGRAFFATYENNPATPNRVVVFDMNSRQRVSMLQAEAGDERFLSAARINNTHIMFSTQTTPGRIVIFQTSPAFVRTGALLGLNNGIDELFFKLLYDERSGFVFVTNRKNPCSIIKFSLRTMERVSGVTALYDEDEFQSGVLMRQQQQPPSNELFGYFGSTSSSASPAKIVKFNLDTMTRVDSASGLSGEYRFFSLVMNNEGTALYVGNGAANPASIIQFAVGGDGVATERVTAVAGTSGDSALFVAVGPVRDNFGIWMTSTDPGVFLEFQLSSTTTSTTTTTTRTSSTTTRPSSTTTTTTSTSSTSLPPSTTSETQTTTTTTTTPTTTATSTSTTSSTTDQTMTSSETITSLFTDQPMTSSKTTNSSATDQVTTSSEEQSSTTTETSTTHLISTFQPSTTLSSTTSSTTSSTKTSTSTLLSSNITTAVLPEATMIFPTTATLIPSPSIIIIILENFTSPGLAGKLQQQLESSALVTGIVAGILASPSAMLTTQRALTVFALTGCPNANPSREQWLFAPLSFPLTLFPGIEVGDQLGGHHRMAVIGFIFVGYPVVFLLTIALWYPLRRKKILRYLPESQKQIQQDTVNKLVGPVRRWFSYFYFVLSISPLPYTLGFYTFQIAGQIATSTGILGAIATSPAKGGGDGIFVDLILLAICPWILLFVLLCIFVNRIRYSVFGVRDDEEDQQQQTQKDEDISNASDDFLEREVRTRIGGRNQIGMILSKFYVPPRGPRTPLWWHKLKLRIAAFLKTKYGRNFIAGYLAWVDNDVEDYVRPKQMTSSSKNSSSHTEKEQHKNQSVTIEEIENSDRESKDDHIPNNNNNNNNNESNNNTDESKNDGDDVNDHHNNRSDSFASNSSALASLVHDGAGRQSSSSSSSVIGGGGDSSTRTGSDIGDYSSDVSRSVYFDRDGGGEQLHPFVASDNLILRFRSTFLKMVGPPLVSELVPASNNNDDENEDDDDPADSEKVKKRKTVGTKINKKLEQHLFPHKFVTKFRIYLAPLGTLPVVVISSMICQLATAIAKSDMEKHCHNSLIIITVFNFIILMFSFFVFPYVVPFRNVTNVALDALIAFASVLSLIIAATTSSDDAAAAVQVITAVSCTIGSIIDVILTGTRNFLFTILNIKLVSAKEKKRLQELYPDSDLNEDGDDDEQKTDQQHHHEKPLLVRDEEMKAKIESAPVIAVESEDDDDDDINYEYSTHYDRDHRRRSVTNISATRRIDLDDALRKAFTLDEEVDQRLKSKKPQNSSLQMPKEQQQQLLQQKGTHDDDMHHSPLKRSSSTRTTTKVDGKSEFRRQQEVALASVLFHICQTMTQTQRTKNHHRNQISAAKSNKFEVVDDTDL